MIIVDRMVSVMKAGIRSNRRVLSLIGHDAERPWIKAIAVEEDQLQQTAFQLWTKEMVLTVAMIGRDSGRVMWRKKPM